MTRRRQLLLFVVLAAGVAHAGSLFLDFNPFWDLYAVHWNPFMTRLSPEVVGRAFTTYVETPATAPSPCSRTRSISRFGAGAPSDTI